MNILVTGGAGFIGSHLCEKLIDLDQKVICIDNFNDFYNPEIKENNIINIVNNNNFKLYREDICNFSKIDKIFSCSKIDIVIHLAARAGVRPSISLPHLYEKTNISGTINILECCKKYGVKKLIFASSSSVYGGNKEIPFSENDRVDCPVSPYAATKKAGELLCYTYHHLYRLSVFCFRFFTVYGPRQRPEMAIHKFTRHIFKNKPIEIFGDGTSSRDYTYIGDTIAALADSLDKISGYEIINLGNSKPIKLLDLVNLIEKAIGKKALLRYEDTQPGDVFTTYADIRKAKKMIKYQPKTSIEKGLEKFITWYSRTRKKENLYEQ